MNFGSFRRSVRRNPAVAGLPMLGLCFGGLYALTTFQQGRYERVDFMRKSQTQREFDLEEELDAVKNERQVLVLQVQELENETAELNALVKKQHGVGDKRQSMAASRMSMAAACRRSDAEAAAPTRLTATGRRWYSPR